ESPQPFHAVSRSPHFWTYRQWAFAETNTSFADDPLSLQSTGHVPAWEVARLRRLGRHRLFYIFAVQPTRRVGVRPKCAWPGNRILYSESRLRLLCLWVTNPLPLGNLLEHQPGTTTWQTSSEIRSPAAGGRLSGPVEYCLAWTPPWDCRYKIEPTPGPN